MCLATLSPKKPAKRGFGYKVFLFSTSTTVVCPCQMDTLRKNKWVTAERRPLNADVTDAPYISGFHIFTKLADARHYQERSAGEVIYRVEYRAAHTQGFQYQYHNGRTPVVVVVADQIRVLRKVASK